MILPPLSDLLAPEQKRHCNEVARLTRFHAFMSRFEENGQINGIDYRLSAIGDGVARFVSPYGDYFYDADIEHEIPGLSHSGGINS